MTNATTPWLTLDSFTLFPSSGGVRLTQGDQSVVLSPREITELHRAYSEGRPLPLGAAWRQPSSEQQGRLIAALRMWLGVPAGQTPPPPHDLLLGRLAEVIAPAPSVGARLVRLVPLLLVLGVLIVAVVGWSQGLPLKWAGLLFQLGLIVGVVWYLLTYRKHL